MLFGQVFIIIWASVAILLSLVVIATYILVEEWRNDLKRVKRLLLIMSMCVLVEGGSAMYVDAKKDARSCKIQAVLIESAIVAVLLYEALLALEMAVITYKFRSGEHTSNWAESNRHIVYHTFVFLVVAFSAVIPYEFDEIVSGGDSLHCHYAAGPSEILILLPALLSIITVVLANIYSVRNILTMMAAFMPTSGQNTDVLRDSAGAAVSASEDLTWTLSGALHSLKRSLRRSIDTFSRFDPYTRKTVFRIVMQPMLYLTLLVMAFVLLATTSTAVGNFATLSLVLVISPANAALWVFNDDVACRVWKNILGGYGVGLSGSSEGYDSSSSNSLDIGRASLHSQSDSARSRQERLLSTGSHMSDVATFTTGDHVSRLSPLIKPLQNPSTELI